MKSLSLVSLKKITKIPLHDNKRRGILVIFLLIFSHRYFCLQLVFYFR